MKRANVLLIEHLLPGNTYTAELVDKLKNYSNVTLLCDRKYQKKSIGVKVKPCLYNGGANKILAMFYYLCALLVTIKELVFGNYDVVHVQTFKSYKIEIPIYSICRVRRISLCCTVHNVLAREKNNDLWNDNGKKFADFYRMCDRLIVHNENSKKALSDYFGVDQKKIHVIPHGVYSFENNICGERTQKVNTFLEFGTIREYKGVDILIKAIELIPEKIRKELSFVIAGGQNKKLDGTNYAGMIKHAGLSECVQLINRRIEDNELPGLFGRADACIFPYRSIWGSGALLMAYSFNKPVIASDIPTFVEETNNGKTGMLFRTENPQELANSIISFHNASISQIDEYKKNIQILVSQKYNWEISAKLTAKLYGGLL